MAHKVHPFAFRLGTTTTWPSRWFARKGTYGTLAQEDVRLRAFFRKELKDAGLNRVDIERSSGAMTITLHSARPGYVIGRSGDGIEQLKKKMMRTFFPARSKGMNIHLAVQEVARPNLEANLVAQGVATDLEKRMAFRRVLKSTIERVKKSGAQGVKIAVSGRLNGAEIARREWLHWGKIPLTNLRANVDYATATAQTIAGAIGVKVWIYRGDVFDQDRMTQYQPTTPRERRDRDGGHGRRDGGRRDFRGPRRDNRGPRDARPSAPRENAQNA